MNELTPEESVAILNELAAKAAAAVPPRPVPIEDELADDDLDDVPNEPYSPPSRWQLRQEAAKDRAKGKKVKRKRGRR